MYRLLDTSVIQMKCWTLIILWFENFFSSTTICEQLFWGMLRRIICMHAFHKNRHNVGSRLEPFHLKICMAAFYSNKYLNISDSWMQTMMVKLKDSRDLLHRPKVFWGWGRTEGINRFSDIMNRILHAKNDKEIILALSKINRNSASVSFTDEIIINKKTV